jgi:transcriptional regulator with XRE-family HTH domain
VSTQDELPPVAGLGPRLRELRQQRNLSVRETARRVGVSHGLISQIETGRTTPSLATLSGLASLFGITLFDPALSAAPPVEGRVVRADARTRVDSAGTKDWRLTPQGRSAFASYFTLVEPHTDSGGYYDHLGGQEFIFVLNGRLEFAVEEESWSLERGDALTLHASERHKWSNPWDEPAELLWILQGEARR